MFQASRTFADDKEKLCLSYGCLPFSWHTCWVASIRIQRKHGRLQVSSFRILWSCLKKQAQGIHKGNFLMSFEVFLPFTHPQTRLVSYSPGLKCHGHVAPLHLLNCMEAVLDHSNLVNRLALILVPKDSYPIRWNVTCMCPWYILLRLLRGLLRLPDASLVFTCTATEKVGSQRMPLSLAEGSR